ncbi:helix-turn-helix transcriptional regulator [Sinorhizobium medicae]|uniref:helix-turn-helix transcriptional regulator n=1 Tax=Sinorhizobium medicae TaxID=110321 RepID=UPI000C7E635D|nr:helix-turn-helix domain-containing protein [Sinorhizobium medicae]MDX0426823.1 helix-turn-helix domain-containing protein [Sinorhizobium medicae]PLU02321.1 DNA-binding protein [Sinorhizobium medicae]PLU64538.1 DNA-binding protein [Sinorhizobium medicae]TWA22759.1 AlpA family transcriptional regulator [Sinorhizobium medicae]TWA43057.1 AlpA family transcriptional regulator [Sinorhizobium medicae]
MKNIRVKEAAAYVGLSKSSLDKLRCFGGGPQFFKLGRAVVYSTADLDAWMAERARTTTWCANDNTTVRVAAA